MNCCTTKYLRLIIGLIYLLIIVFSKNEISAQTTFSYKSHITFYINTYDGLELPAQVIEPSQASNLYIIFIMGGTPYNEKGDTGGIWDENCVSIAENDECYKRFIEKLPSLGYGCATMAKRNFVYPCFIPRPTLDDFALDICFFIKELQNRNLIRSEKEIVLIGHSEGSIVATKVLGLLKKQPAGCILLGSGSLAFDYNNESWEQWYFNDVMKRISNFSDEQIIKIFELFKQIHNEIVKIDEETFENEWKKNKYPADFALWESYHCIKEYNVYNPIPNLLSSNIPILICIGENDTSMPMLLAKRTYDELEKKGYYKAEFHVIKGEDHQFKRDEVFSIIDYWIHSLE